MTRGMQAKALDNAREAIDRLDVEISGAADLSDVYLALDEIATAVSQVTGLPLEENGKVLPVGTFLSRVPNIDPAASAAAALLEKVAGMEIYDDDASSEEEYESAEEARATLYEALKEFLDEFGNGDGDAAR